MVWGKKKQEESVSQSIVIDPTQQPQLPGQEQYTQQIPQAPVQEPMQQQTQASVQQQTQQPAQVVPEAVIIQGFITEEGTYKYVVETNYPLAIGHCKITQ